MGRELRRKEAKRNKENITKINKKETTEPKQEVYKILKTLTIVLVVLIIIYLLVGIFITKEIKFGNNNKSNTNGDMTNARSKILVSEIFKQSEEKYYVYFYDFNNTINSIDRALVSKLYESKIYKVDMSSGFNTKYKSETGNSNAKTIEELKIKIPTLILIENDTITMYLEGETNILNYINN